MKSIGKVLGPATLHFSFLDLEHLSEVELKPPNDSWTLSKHKIHSSFYKNKKEVGIAVEEQVGPHAWE